jgi:small basic protein
MAFRDILKKQRQSGKGLISSIASASNKSMLESIDPRNKIFKKGSLLNALFPSVKGYSADGDKSLSKAITPQQTPGVANVEVLAKLDVLADKMDVVGKNTMVMPLMMRDSNIMRQSLVKLVKLSGGTQRDKADRFFQTSKDRESLYESQFKKSTKTTLTPTTPTPAAAKTDSDGGFLNMLLKGLLAGGILAGIGKLMEDPAIREIVKEYVQKFVTSVVDGIKAILSTILETEIDIEGFKMSLGTAIAGVIGVFLGLKLAIAALTAYITSKIGGASIPSGGVPDVPDRSKPGGKTPTPGAPGTPGKTDDKPKKVERYRDPKTGRFAKMPKPGMSAGGIAGRALGVAAILGLAVDLVYTSDDEIAILRDAGFSKSKVFDKLTEEEQDSYLEKVYTKEVKDSEVKAEREALMKKYNLEATGTMLRWKEQYIEKPAPTSPTPTTAATGAGLPAGVKAPAMAQPNKLPGQAPAPTTQASVRAIDNAMAVSKTSTNSPMKADNLTPSKSYSDAVGKSESGGTRGNYDTVYGQPGNAKINGKPVTQNTIGEVIEWQNKMRSSNRHAAGKYQFINVADAANNAGLSTTALFDGINQELMQKVFTERNAKALKQSGIEPTNENLGLAHSVGAAGASKLLQAQQSGQGNLIAADVLGLKGAARDTNPHLMKPVSQVIASNESKFNGTPPSGVRQPPTTMVAQVPAAPVRPATQIASASTSLADTMRTQMQTPVVINAPTTNNNNVRNGGNGGQRSTTAPSIIDSELMKLLVERIAT